MEDTIFLERLAKFKAMPEHITDARDFQLAKTRPYPRELKASAFNTFYQDLSDEQRSRLPYLFEPGEPSAVYALDALCDLFLQSDPVEQWRLTDSPLADALDFNSINTQVWQIKTVDDVEVLRHRLAAAVLLNGRDDFRDILMALAALWLQAARAGIDPLLYFQEAARMARTDDPYGTGSTREVLANFHTSAIFRAQVEPYLTDPPVS